MHPSIIISVFFSYAETYIFTLHGDKFCVSYFQFYIYFILFTLINIKDISQFLVYMCAYIVNIYTGF